MVLRRLGHRYEKPPLWSFVKVRVNLLYAQVVGLRYLLADAAACLVSTHEWTRKLLSRLRAPDRKMEPNEDYSDRPDPLYLVLSDAWSASDASPGFTKPFSDLYQLFHRLSNDTISQLRITRAQEKSFWILWHWWSTYRSSCQVSEDAPASQFRRHLAEGVSYELGVESLYFKRILGLFEHEFGGPGFARYGSDLMVRREEAAKFSACHYVALHGYRNALRDPNCQLRNLDKADHEVMLALPPPRGPTARQEKLVLGGDLAGIHPRCPTGATLRSCHWLPECRDLPFYLWDRETRQVVATERLSDWPAYTAISHTWGRWQKPGACSVRVEGVGDWLVPQNTIFEVRSLPTILAGVPTSSRYIWFDLVCIPQDGSPKAGEEIARQAAIFRNAEHAIIWFNRLSSWSGLEEALEYMCSIFLSVDPKGMPTTTGGATGFFEEYSFDSTIRREQMVTDGWFSSLWTLQEICLRPDMWLCNADWELFSIENATVPVAMDTVIALTQECTLGLDGRAFLAGEDVFSNGPPLFNVNTEQVPPDEMLGKLIGFGIYHRGYLELLELFNRTGMSYIHFIRRDLILLLGSHRFCRDLRAEAIMSVVGSRGWKAEYDAGNTKLVLDMYPLSFVQEARCAIGANFFNSASVSSRPISPVKEGTAPEPRGSLMPFESKRHGSEAKLVLDWIFSDEMDHPSVASWRILETGSVAIPRAGIYYSTREEEVQGGEGELVCNVWLTHESPEQDDARFIESRKARRFRTVELRSWLRTYFPYSESYAVELCRVNSRIGSRPSSRGILLKETSRGSRTMFKIGNYISSTFSLLSQSQVVERRVDWTVL